MRSIADRRQNRLPKRLPPGTIYVVEGRGGENGCLRVSSRYLVLPGGGRIDISPDRGQAASARAVGRRRPRENPLQIQAKNWPPRATKKFAAMAKKFARQAGTTRQSQR